MIEIHKAKAITFAKLKPESIIHNVDGTTFDSIIRVECAHCNKEYFIPTTRSNIQKYVDGTNVQYAFPHLNADDRELILSNTCVKCWDELMKDINEGIVD